MTSINSLHEQQGKIKWVLSDRIPPQSRTVNFLITAINEHHPRKTFDMVDIRLNMQPFDLNYKPHGGTSLRDLVDFAMGNYF